MDRRCADAVSGIVRRTSSSGPRNQHFKSLSVLARLVGFSTACSVSPPNRGNKVGATGRRYQPERGSVSAGPARAIGAVSLPERDVGRAAVQRVVLALKLVMDAAELTDAEMDSLADLILPKFVKHSGSMRSPFRQSCTRCIVPRRSVWRCGIERHCQVCSGRRQCPRWAITPIRRRLQGDRVQ